MVQALIDEYRLVYETGLGSAGHGGGRRPRCLAFDGRSHQVIGLDIGTTHIHVVLANLDGETLSERRIPSHYDSGFENIMNTCCDEVEALIAQSPNGIEPILGVGMAVAGLINRRTQMVEVAPKFGWKDVDPVAVLSKRIDLPIIADYVVRVMTLGEKWYGRGAEFDDFICVSLSHGIGAGMVIDGNIFYGAKGMCGELGHIVVDRDSKVLCKCGNRGCLSALASGYGIAMSAQRAIENGEQSKLISRYCEGDFPVVSAEIVAIAAKQGDPLAERIFREAAEYIGVGLVNLLHLFNPQAIFLGGGLVQAGDLLLDTVRETIGRKGIDRLVQDVEILPVTHGMRTTTMGAIALILREVLKMNILPEQSREHAELL